MPIGLPRNEAKGETCKSARNLNVKNNSQTTFQDVIATTKFQLKENTIKKDSPVCKINAKRHLTKTIRSLRS